MDGVQLEFAPEALEYMVDQAIAFKMGARGLRSLCEAVLTDAMYDLPSSSRNRLRITRRYAEEKISQMKGIAHQ